MALTLGDNHGADLGLDLREGLLARERNLGHRVLLHILRFGIGIGEDLRGLRLGFLHDLGRIGLRFGHQTFRLGTAFLQSLVVELLG